MVVAYRREHFAFAFFFAVVGLYELLPLAMYWSVKEDSELLHLTQFISAVATDTDIRVYNVGLLALLFLSSFGYWALGYFRRETQNRCIRKSQSIQVFHLVPIALLAFGLVSVWTGSGAARAADYEYQSAGFGAVYQSPAIFYGRSIYVVGVALVLVLWSRKKWWQLALYGACLLPMTWELFIAGRRQAFAPVAVLLLLGILYYASRRTRTTVFLLTLCLFLFASTVQFVLRSDYYVESIGWDGLSLAILPTVLEFVFVGATSVRSFLWSQNEGPDGGLHILVGLLDGIPYFKAGTYFTTERMLPVSGVDMEWISPRGAFSMAGDLVLALGFLGFVALAIFVAPCLRACHEVFREVFQKRVTLNTSNLLALSVAATFLTQYRNGFVAAINSALYISIIYVALVLPMVLVRASARKGANPMASTVSTKTL